MNLQAIKVTKQLSKTVKISLTILVVICALFVIGAMKEVPVYEVRKEVAL